MSHPRNYVPWQILNQFAVEVGGFDALRVMLVTGAIFTAPLFEFTHRAFGRHIHLASISGGTDICGGCE